MFYIVRWRKQFFKLFNRLFRWRIEAGRWSINILITKGRLIDNRSAFKEVWPSPCQEEHKWVAVRPLYLLNVSFMLLKFSISSLWVARVSDRSRKHYQSEGKGVIFALYVGCDNVNNVRRLRSIVPMRWSHGTKDAKVVSQERHQVHPNDI